MNLLLSIQIEPEKPLMAGMTLMLTVALPIAPSDKITPNEQLPFVVNSVQLIPCCTRAFVQIQRQLLDLTQYPIAQPAHRAIVRPRKPCHTLVIGRSH